MTAAATTAPARFGTGTIGVVAVHAAPLVRWGLRARLQTAPGWRWLGSTGDPRVLLPAVTRLNPQLLLLDSGVDPTGTLTEALTDRHAQLAVVLLARDQHRGSDYLRQAHRAGAAGAVPDDVDPATLPDFLHRALRGEAFSHPELTRNTIRQPQPAHSSSRDRSDGAPVAPTSLLSSRETQVLHLIAAGLNTDAISAELGISRETVRTHVKKVFHKLDASSRAQAIARAYLRGLVANEPLQEKR